MYTLYVHKYRTKTVCIIFRYLWTEPNRDWRIFLVFFWEEEERYTYTFLNRRLKCSLIQVINVWKTFVTYSIEIKPKSRVNDCIRSFFYEGKSETHTHLDLFIPSLIVARTTSATPTTTTTLMTKRKWTLTSWVIYLFF